MRILLDWYHSLVLHLFVCSGVSYDETQEQEDEKRQI
jgi:hypothetical protein